MICEVEVEVAVNNRSSERERANKDHKITHSLLTCNTLEAALTASPWEYAAEMFGEITAPL
jgi:hypothetical protein